MIDKDDKERVRQATDIVQLVGETVELRQRGREFWGCCPFHHEKTPSFKVNPDTRLWHCFGCGQGGDAFDYVMRRESLEFPDAIRYLADRAGIEIHETNSPGQRGPKKTRLNEVMLAAEEFYTTMLLRGRGEGPAAARTYLAGRGFGSAVCRRWGLGYSPGRGALVSHLRSKGFSYAEIQAANLGVDRSGRLVDRFYERAMFPIHDELGRSIAFGGRILGDGKPKYLNTAETPIFSKSRNLYALDRAKESIVAAGEVVVVEGYTDVIALHEAGLTNVVATLGTALTAEHVKLLSRFAKTIICMFDGDAAGQAAAEKAIQYLTSTEASLRCVILPDNLDPAEFVAARGVDALREVLSTSVPLMDFVFTKRLGSLDLSSPGKRISALDGMAKLLAPLKRSILLDGYATSLADALGMDVDKVREAILRAPVGKAREVAGSNVAPEYDEVPYEDLEAPEVPLDDAVQVESLSSDDRRQLHAERELLALMAAAPDLLRPYGERIANVLWVDARHESIAWAIMATPPGTPAASAVDAAIAVVPDAPRILSAGEVASSQEMDSQQKVDFLLDTVELFSSKRRVRQMKARLRTSASTMSSDEVERTFQEATALQRHVNELATKLAMSQID